MPVVTAAVAVLVEKKVPSREECGALILLTMGVTVTVFEGKATGSGAGLFLCVAGELQLDGPKPVCHYSRPGLIAAENTRQSTLWGKVASTAWCGRLQIGTQGADICKTTILRLLQAALGFE